MRLTQTDLAAALPDVESTIRIGELDGPVDIVRDGWGVPHIRATTESKLIYYCQCTNHYIGRGSY